ncbi:MAG TPA: serine--tRNA ligase, partial [Thermoplasmata archaeon]|nr:serine--tRNA ligase [Thermoplasmata archaeon]
MWFLMLDAKFIRENEAAVRQAFADRRHDIEVLDRFFETDGRWRSLVDEGNSLRKHRNDVAEEIPRMSGDERSSKIAEMKGLAQRIKDI